MPDDSHIDDGVTGQWLSISELAETRQITKASARRLVHRRQWRRQKDNHGVVRHFVPRGEADPRQDSPTDRREDEPQAVVAAQAEHIATLKDQLSKAEARADKLQTELDAWVAAGWWRRRRLRKARARR